MDAPHILPWAEVSVVAEAVTAEGLVGPIYEAVSIRSLRGREAEVAALKASLVLFAGLATTSKGDRMSVTENEDEAAEAGAIGGFRSEAGSEMASSLIAPFGKKTFQ